MNFNEFCLHIVKPENHHLIEIFFGITYKQFEAIKTVFIEEPCGDTKKKLTLLEKFIAALLLERYKFEDKEAQELLSFTSLKQAKDIKDVLLKRLKNALDKKPFIKLKLTDRSKLPMRSTYFFKNYSDFSNFYQDTMTNYAISGSRENGYVNNKGVKFANSEYEADETWVKRYLTKPVASKKKNGQASLLQLYTAVIFDIEEFPSKADYIAFYLAIVLNVHLHHATYRPADGYDKCSSREIAHPLFYARSQNSHPFWNMFRLLTASNLRLLCIMPINKDVVDIMRSNLGAKNSFITKLDRYDDNGYKKAIYAKKAKDENSHFCLQVAYSGVRKNVANSLTESVQNYVATKGFAPLFERVKETLSVRADVFRPILKLNPSVLNKRIKHVWSMLYHLRMKHVDREYKPNLYTELSKYRTDNAKQILAQTCHLKKLKVKFDGSTNCLDIEFYPLIKNKIRESANYSDGVTNFIICYFIGLLNHRLKSNELSVIAHRRQSFGFNQITITDTTSMCMRVSLGYEPHAFVDIFSNCLIELDSLLKEFDFFDKENKYLIKAFRAAEEPMGDEETERTGNYFRNAMRTSDKVLGLSKFCEDILDKNANRKGYERHAMICAIKKIVDEKIPTFDGVTQENIILEEDRSEKDNILISGLINNLLVFALEKMNNTTEIDESPELKHSYCHIISTLIKYLYKMEGLIKYHQDYHASHIYTKTLTLANDVMEYLALLDGLWLAHLQKNDKVRKLGEASALSEPYDKLCRTEKNHAVNQLSIPENDVDVYFCDNGEQALTMGIACLGMQYNPDTKQFLDAVSTKIYLSDKCYFEFEKNLKTNMGIKPCGKQEAEFVYIDIREISDFKNKIDSFPEAKVVIIDVTHNPCLTGVELKAVIHKLHSKSIRVMLISSMLKHEQLGKDKHQAGKMIILNPPGDPLDDNVKDTFDKISKTSMTPHVASYFQMMNEICRDKIIPAAPAPLAAVAAIDPASDDETPAPTPKKKVVAMDVDKKKAPVVDKKKATAVPKTIIVLEKMAEVVIQPRSAASKANSASTASAASSVAGVASSKASSGSSTASAAGMFKPTSAAANKRNLAASAAASASAASSAAADAPVLTFDQRKAESVRLAKIEKEAELAAANEKLNSKPRRPAKK